MIQSTLDCLIQSILHMPRSGLSCGEKVMAHQSWAVFILFFPFVYTHFQLKN